MQYLKKMAMIPMLLAALSGCPDKSRLQSPVQPDLYQNQPSAPDITPKKSYLWGSEGQNRIRPFIIDGQEVLVDDPETDLDVKVNVQLSSKVPNCYALTSTEGTTVRLIKKMLDGQPVPVRSLKKMDSKPELFDYPLEKVAPKKLDQLCNEIGIKRSSGSRIITADRVHSYE